VAGRVPPERPAYLEINGWKVFAHPLFVHQVETLVEEVERMSRADPKGYVHKSAAKVLAAIVKMAFEVIPANPADRMFNQGNTMGGEHRHWRRAKFFAGRYRLFFRYSSSSRVIVLAWVNDAERLRTYGKKTDAYAVFSAMLRGGNPPSDWDALVKASAKETRLGRLKGKTNL
jgi:toxin YhaV